jgi:hypothetical protein
LSKKTNNGHRNTLQKMTIWAKKNNGQQNTIQRTTIWAKTQTMVNKILYRKRLLEQKHKQRSKK